MKLIKPLWNWISVRPIRKAIFVFVILFLILPSYLYLSYRDYVVSNPTKALFMIVIVASLSAVYAYRVEKKRANKERFDER